MLGERVEPWRARPVPFWRNGLAPPPRTMPRVLVACVPRRRAACSARTTSCTSGPLNGAPNTSSSRVSVWSEPRIGALGIGADLHGGALGARDRAADEHQVLAGDQLDDRQALLGDALAAHAARAADPLEHARRRRRGADRARGAHVVRAVGLWTGVEVVALDRALEALALGHARDLDGLADLECLDGHGVADRELARLVAELDERPHGRRVDFPEVAELRLRQRPLADRAEAELDGDVAVDLVRADRGDGTGSRLEHRHALDAAVLAEPLGHAELLGEDRGHQPKASRISMSTPAGRWSSRWSESTVFGVGWWMSISRLWVRISKCSCESLSLNGDLITA